ncbi:MAG TPA: L,D-transpeptidase family protein [Acidimicrobiales bacterium]|jgi:hypothetical protein|nr:L,D-transpeptidase family protein [Acidimicrobiales bacterium]
MRLFRGPAALMAALFAVNAASSAAGAAPAPVAAMVHSATATPDVAGQPVPFGHAAFYGSPGTKLAKPVVAMAATPDGGGYYEVAADGGVFNYGDAKFYGSTGADHLVRPIIGLATAKGINGYWLVASDGGVFAFGQARFYGSTGGVKLAKPIVGIAATPDGLGYWLVASDGGIFSFGDARFHGSTGGVTLAKPVVGMAPSANGLGYWLVASDGGIFAFGDARFYGSTGSDHLIAPVVGMASTTTGDGYWLAASDGGVFAFGHAPFAGSMGGSATAAPVAAIIGDAAGAGYWLLPVMPPPPPPAPPAVPAGQLQEGDSGAAVLALQQRLTALGYWSDTPDGQYGDATVQAVYALQKAAGLTPDGVAGPATEAALAQGVKPTPQPSSGYNIQINLAKDLIMFVNNGQVEWTLNTSTGGGYTYTQDGQTDVADTPTGHFNTYRVVDGTVTDSLGTLWRPRFFYEGFAIHGDDSVPPYPVSHGCARISNEAIDWVWASNLDPIGTPVWVY